MRHRGPVWQLAFAGPEASVPHSKGLADIARLLASPGADEHALDLVGGLGPVRSGWRRGRPPGPWPHRRRLADLDTEIDEADSNHDLERRARAEAERQALLDELGRATGTGGRTRAFANHPGERARKAVSGRIRDAIGKLEPVLPELAAHLQRSIVTGA
jgi:hypothetical protein